MVWTETLTHIATRMLSRGGSVFYFPLPRIIIKQSEDNTLVINAQHLNVQVKTNDLVNIKASGEFEILGRIDNVINSGGLKIFPEEIEVLLKKSLNRELVIIGKNDDELGQKLVLIIEGEAAVESNVLASTIELIVKNKRPKEIRYLSAFPRTESGKIIRKLIF